MMTGKLVLKGKYNEAIVYTDQIDEDVKEQILELLDEAFIEGERIAIMPDTHIGKGAVIGTTVTTNNGKVCPNLVGVDIGCGIFVTRLNVRQLKQADYKALDRQIKQNIPTAHRVRNKASKFDLIDDLSFKIKKTNRMLQSLGSLGGGNHFIEIAQDEQGLYYLMVHSGSRAFGHTISRHHQQIAEDYAYPENGDHKVNNKNLSYLEGNLLTNYINDLQIAQNFAAENRRLMTEIILSKMGWQSEDEFDSIHNYIDPETGILRKGATDASKGKRLVIPLNMRDGALIAMGKGNPTWNYSAPHGAGRKMSRTKARQSIEMNHFKDSMEGIYSTSVNVKTLDEAPMAYKSLEDITANLDETLEILHQLKTVYSFKG